MLKLIRMEMKKQKLAWFYRGAVIATILCAGFMFLIAYTEGGGDPAFGSFADAYTERGGGPAFEGFADALSIAGLLCRAVFIVFASVLLSRFIIEEYKNKTISLLFTYPIERKNLIMAKMLLVLALTLGAMLISTFITCTSILVLNSYFPFIPGKLEAGVLLHTGIQLLIQTLSAACLSLIPLYFGMRKKSVPTTIVSSIIIVGLVSSNNQGYSLSNNITVPLILGIIGLLIAYLSFRNVDKTDVA
ncbi:ABC transporter permease [Paenibacillus sp.]|jgi:ABC-type transport system involved in multi-copper enzyme maturation permease subunit|uniref:ABC transporter permease n=1 Tax=Paenibacillus sp. TaxID=58172 RepID=UPI00282CCA26|nr:ABC transporter permease [Paenibacillus sp.]MDR0269905.1 ABC transporter permease [Paenibacillus sp.]